MVVSSSNVTNRVFLITVMLKHISCINVTVREQNRYFYGNKI